MKQETQRALQSPVHEKQRPHIQVGLVDLVDDLQVSGQQLLQQLHRPALQSLGQDRVVGVGKRALGQVPGLQRTNQYSIKIHSAALVHITTFTFHTTLHEFVLSHPWFGPQSSDLL